MPKNKVQFQRGMGLHEFLNRYGTLEQCEAALFASRWPQGFPVPAVAVPAHRHSRPYPLRWIYSSLIQERIKDGHICSLTVVDQLVRVRVLIALVQRASSSYLALHDLLICSTFRCLTRPDLLVFILLVPLLRYYQQAGNNDAAAFLRKRGGPEFLIEGVKYLLCQHMPALLFSKQPLGFGIKYYF